MKNLSINLSCGIAAVWIYGMWLLSSLADQVCCLLCSLFFLYVSVSFWFLSVYFTYFSFLSTCYIFGIVTNGMVMMPLIVFCLFLFSMLVLVIFLISCLSRVLSSTERCAQDLVRFCVFLCFVLDFSVKVKLSVPLLCVCVLPGKAVSEITCALSGGTLNPTHSLTPPRTCD